MSPKEIIQELLSNPQSTILVLVVGLILFLAGHYFQAFFAEKGKQHAEKEIDTTKESPFSGKYIDEIWHRTCEESQDHLIKFIKGAKTRITIFGLTRNFYMSNELRKEVAAQAQRIPVVFFMMDPGCDSRRDRYRIEPLEASLEDPNRYIREIEDLYLDLLKTAPTTDAGSSNPGLAIYYFNFPCSFAIEESDDILRIMLYGHGKRGTEGPIFSVRKKSDLYEYFSSQLRWLEALACNPDAPPWVAKGVRLRKLKLGAESSLSATNR